MSRARFVLRKGTTGKFRFHLIGANGKVMATSAAYESRASALRAIELVRKHAPKAELVDQAGTRVVGAARAKRAHGSSGVGASDAGPVPDDEVPIGDLIRPRVVA